MTTWSGTEPAIIAATLDSILVSATVTMPTPNVRSDTPRSSADISSRQDTRSDRPLRRSDAGEDQPRDDEARAAREERRLRAHGDLDREVRRAPDDVDRPERRPDLPSLGPHAQ